jgi:methylated-DNA-protein-cysteine methyltransferase-like protein
MVDGGLTMTPRFTSPPDPEAFNARIWEIVREIPAGKVSTYGQIAAMLPPPESMDPGDFKAFAARWVGGAMAACPDWVPWQRVINSQGKISRRKSGGHIRQRELLEMEGVEFDQRQRVDFGQVGWDGPALEWLQARGLKKPPSLSKPRQTRMDL